ncbi:conserved hypothetical protein [Ricinus communis]|uniref:Uncharacterized protein n=1 Tax=Ricinus communis TaxID=3988 RepID=B9RJE6_RICCO|nr:conserved hypothetical protein [Ricinus communis]
MDFGTNRKEKKNHKAGSTSFGTEMFKGELLICLSLVADSAGADILFADQLNLASDT